MSSMLHRLAFFKVYLISFFFPFTLSIILVLLCLFLLSKYPTALRFHLISLYLSFRCDMTPLR